MIPTVFGTETRTVELFPFADSHISVDSPEDNYGKELYLTTEYEEQKTIVEATSFVVPPGSRWITVSLPKNGKITGSFEVTEGGNRDINFWIARENLANPAVAFISEERVTNLDFSFVAPYSGEFYLGFDNSFSWFTSKTVSLSDITLRTEPLDVIYSPIFLLFDLSNIPPEATINSANLYLSYKDSGENRESIVNTYYCSNDNWDEQTITYENALSDLYPSSSSSLSVSEEEVGKYYRWDIKADVVRNLSSGKLTEVVVIVDSSESTGMIQFFSRESENKPRLEISYSYVSVTSSISSSILLEGQSVIVNLDTDPSQTSGNLKVQYSSDKVNWMDATTLSGGTADYAWTPPVIGSVHVRCQWEINWDGGSYTSQGSTKSIFVIPLFLIVLIPVVIIAIIIGVYFLRRRKAKNSLD